MKKLLASLLAIAMVLGLCACGSGSTASSAAPASEPTEAASAPEQKPAEHVAVIVLLAVLLRRGILGIVKGPGIR